MDDLEKEVAELAMRVSALRQRATDERNKATGAKRTVLRRVADALSTAASSMEAARREAEIIDTAIGFTFVVQRGHEAAIDVVIAAPDAPSAHERLQRQFPKHRILGWSRSGGASDE